MNRSLDALGVHLEELATFVSMSYFDPIAVPQEDLSTLLGYGEELEANLTQHLHGEDGGNPGHNRNRLLGVTGEWMAQMTVVYRASAESD